MKKERKQDLRVIKTKKIKAGTRLRISAFFMTILQYTNSYNSRSHDVERGLHWEYTYHGLSGNLQVSVSYLQSSPPLGDLCISS